MKEVFGETNTILSQKQPANLLRILTSKVKNDINTPGLFKCNNNNCKICLLYIQPCESFVTSSNVRWHIRSHINCHSKNVIYYLKCNSCHQATTYIGKTTNLRLRTNNHISSCRNGNSCNNFDNHVFRCMGDQNVEPYFQLFAFMKLANEQNLLFYENLLQCRGYDTLNN